MYHQILKPKPQKLLFVILPILSSVNWFTQLISMYRTPIIESPHELTEVAVVNPSTGRSSTPSEKFELPPIYKRPALMSEMDPAEVIANRLPEEVR